MGVWLLDGGLDRMLGFIALAYTTRNYTLRVTDTHRVVSTCLVTDSTQWSFFSFRDHAVARLLTLHTWTHSAIFSAFQLSTNCSLGTPELNWLFWMSLMLRPTVSRSVCLGIKHPSGAYDQIFITVRQLQVCWLGTLSLTRGRVYRLQLLLVLASAVILGSEYRWTVCLKFETSFFVASYDSQGHWLFSIKLLITTTIHGQKRKHRFQQYFYYVFTDQLLRNGFVYFCVRVRFRENLFTEPLPNNELFLLSCAISQYEQVYISVHTAWDMINCARVRRSLGRE
jgi:hypothetical protein